MIHTVVPPPTRNISVPRLPKKYIGERPKCVMNSTVIKSRYPFTVRSRPNFEQPYLRARWSTTFSPMRLNPACLARNGMKRCISP